MFFVPALALPKILLFVLPPIVVLTITVLSALVVVSAVSETVRKAVSVMNHIYFTNRLLISIRST